LPGLSECDRAFQGCSQQLRHHFPQGKHKRVAGVWPIVVACQSLDQAPRHLHVKDITTIWGLPLRERAF
jgi:hypothetical protein